MYNIAKHYDVILVGKQGENRSRTLQFDYSAWLKEFGEGLVTIVYQRSEDASPYPISVEQSNGIATWHPSSADTQYAGSGVMEITYVVNDVIAKSVTYCTLVAESLGQSVDPPAPYQSWVDMVIEKAGEAVQAKEGAEDARDAAQAAQAGAETAQTGAQTAKEGAESAKQAILDTSATASVDANVGTPSVVVTKTEVEGHANLNFAFHNIKGNKGDKGDKGNVMFATFAINPLTGILTMQTDEEYTGANFSINNSYLEVTI